MRPLLRRSRIFIRAFRSSAASCSCIFDDALLTARLNQQVRRNRKRFPDDFLFEVTADELINLKLHFSTSSWGGRRKAPLAFTEHGAIMAATVLNSARAVEMSVYVVRAFVKLRELLASDKDLPQKLVRLERSLLALDLRTQHQFKEVYDAIRALMVTPPPKKRPIGFTADLDWRSSTPSSSWGESARSSTREETGKWRWKPSSGAD